MKSISHHNHMGMERETLG